MFIWFLALQFYVQASLPSGMQQAPPAIAPAPGPQTSTNTTSLHQPLQHPLAPQPLPHPGVSPSPMPQVSHSAVKSLIFYLFMVIFYSVIILSYMHSL